MTNGNHGTFGKVEKGCMEKKLLMGIDQFK
jgi:hypothetical protein